MNQFSSKATSLAGHLVSIPRVQSICDQLANQLIDNPPARIVLGDENSPINTLIHLLIIEVTYYFEAQHSRNEEAVMRFEEHLFEECRLLESSLASIQPVEDLLPYLFDRLLYYSKRSNNKNVTFNDALSVGKEDPNEIIAVPNTTNKELLGLQKKVVEIISNSNLSKRNQCRFARILRPFASTK